MIETVEMRRREMSVLTGLAIYLAIFSNPKMNKMTIWNFLLTMETKQIQ